MRRLRHLLLLLLAAAPLLAGPPISVSRVIIQNFRSRELRPDGSIAWTLHGGQAVVTGARAALTEVQGLLMVEGEEYHLTSPGCVYEKEQQTLRSTEPVQVRGPRLLLDGVGYDVDLATRRIVVRKDVRLKLFNSPVAMLAKPPPEQ
jgi:hypothetical protein